MEEEKAAAYYDELNRKGEGARRFKQGLGFSSSSDPASFPSKPAGSSFLSGFVRAGAAPAQAQPPIPAKPPPPPERSSSQRRRSRSPPRARSRSPSRSSRRRSRSRSRSRERRHRFRSREREREDRRASRRRSRSKSRSRSPSRRSSRSLRSASRRERDHHGDRRRDYGGGRESSKGRSGSNGGKVDYALLIDGYDRMTPAERVKAKMKLQLSETAAKDSTLGTTHVRWERFDFNKDAPLDEDENDVEVANDDASLVKNIGKSFRLSAVESKREDKVRAAHDEAIFGVPGASVLHLDTAEDELKTNDDDETTEDIEAQPSSSLISDKVLATQKGSWRERAQKLRQGSNS